MTLTKIRKRDGRLAEFNEEKIARAIEKAFNATYKPGRGEEARKLADEVLSILEVEGQAQPDVEHIQDLVERVLMDNGYVQTAKSYILYREERSRAREMNTRLMKTYEDITFSKAKDSDIKRENANIDGDTAMGSMLKFGSEGAKQFYDMFVLNPDHARAHREGDIHIHDLDFLTLTTTCCQIDIKKLFEGGFSTGHGTLREPNDISSYAALCCIAIQSNQNDQHGGQSVVNFDYGMADGVRKTFARVYRQNLARALMLLEGREDPERELKALMAQLKADTGLAPTLEDCGDYFAAERAALVPAFGTAEQVEKAQAFAHQRAVKETDRATYQAMEALIHNLNTMHSRAGAQTPFSSINYGMDTSPEGRMVMKNVMLATEAGLGERRDPHLPHPDLPGQGGGQLQPRRAQLRPVPACHAVLRQAAVPQFLLHRRALQPAILQARPPRDRDRLHGLPHPGHRQRVRPRAGDLQRPGQPVLHHHQPAPAGHQGQGDLDVFFEGLDRMLDLCVEQLLERFEIQCRKHVYNYPFLMGQGVWLDSDKLDWDDEVREVLRHGTLTVGFIGLAETLKALVGVHHGESEKAQVLGLEIISHMRARMDEEAAKRGLNFSLIATPAEGLSGRFVKLDRARYGSIEGITDREYYTNSFHVPVYYPISAYDKIRIEAPYHALTNAGHISYIEMDGDPTDNLEAFEKVIRCMKESGIGYGSVNHPVDRDPVCGFSGIIGDQCPGCGRTEADGVPFERIRRITGYLVGTLDRFNNGKRAEERDRVKHSV